MKEDIFNDAAYDALSHLFELLQETSKYMDLDVELSDGILYITLPSDEQYVINKHGPSKQIWLSSPITGASYYNYDESSNIFINKSQESLLDKVQKELAKYE